MVVALIVVEICIKPQHRLSNLCEHKKYEELQHIMEAATYWEMIWLGSNNYGGYLLDELHTMQWGNCEVSISVRKGVC
jgi:hypothetical protein